MGYVLHEGKHLVSPLQAVEHVPGFALLAASVPGWSGALVLGRWTSRAAMWWP
jgi:hypothetical protein